MNWINKTLILLINLMLFFITTNLAHAQSVSHYIYQDSLNSSWVDHSWDTLTTNYAVTNPVFAGSKSMSISPGRGWTAWQVINSNGLDVSPYAYFSFTARGTATTSWWEVQFLDQNWNSMFTTTYKFQPSTNWTTHTINLNEYGIAYMSVYGVRFWYVTADPATSTIHVDQMGFGGIAPTPTITPTPAPQTFSASVNTSTIVNPFSKHMLGMGHANWEHSWGKYFAGAVPGLDAIYKSAGVGLIRYAGGLWANWVGWERTTQKTPYTDWKPTRTNFSSQFQNLVNINNTYSFHYGTDEIDSLALLAQRSGADVIMQVNMSTADPYMWADMVRYTNIEKGYNFKYWELGNEIDLECQQGKESCVSAADYQTRVSQYISAMKSVDPSIIIVGGVPASGGHDIVANNWADTQNISRYLVSAKNAGADAYSYHWYTDCNLSKLDNIFTWAWDTAKPHAWQNLYSRVWSQTAPSWVQTDIINPTNKNSEQGITELNVDACDFGRAPVNSNNISALWYADVLGRLAYNGLDFVTWYEGYGNGSQGYPAVWVETDNPSSISSIYLRPSFYTTFMYGNFFGDQMVQVTNSNTNLGIYASKDSKNPNTLKFIVTNMTPNLAVTTINISGFNVQSGYKYEMTNTNPLDRGAASNGQNHGSTINGFKLLSTNITTAANDIPKRNLSRITLNQIQDSFQPYSVTAVILTSSNSSSVTPAPVSSADANGDGKVDGVDYIIWLSHFNQNVAGVVNGDFNNSGNVDGADYVIWALQYSS